MTWNFLVSSFLEDVNKHKTTILYLFIIIIIIIIIIFNLDTVFYNSTSEKLTNIRRQIERRGIRKIDFDTAWIQSLRDVFATVVFVVP